MQLENNLAAATPWEIREERFDPEHVVTTGSTFMTGNGYLGYRGTFADDGAEQYAACVLSDTWDNADGKWTELVTAPNGLFTELSLDGVVCPWRSEALRPAAREYRRALNLRYGVWSARVEWTDRGVTVAEERFSGRTDLHLIAASTVISASRPVSLKIRTGIDGHVWSLNGDHFSELQLTAAPGVTPEQLEALAVTGERRYDVIVRETAELLRDNGESCAPTDLEQSERGIFRVFSVDLAAGQAVRLHKYVGVASTNDLRSTNAISTDAARGPRPTRAAVRAIAGQTVADAARTGWDALVREHRNAWDTRWDKLDIEIAGDELAQVLLRYNLYQNVIATPAHADHLPIGARGLSCQAYQGAAFWDQEIFNLPMFLFTDPAVARNLLVYRYRTLDGARKKARDLGYRGAFYAWISGDTGEEICPSWFFKDVITGRPIRNHFNDWQIHISPDIAYTIWKYVTVTDDREYLRLFGAEIVFEIARFLHSRVHYRKDLHRYEVIRVLGPDEYHENVDNNYFTNYQARFALAYAREVYDWMHRYAREDLKRVTRAIGLQQREPGEWREIAELIHVPEPDPTTGLIEQFERFFELEDTTPEVVRERLIDPGEYWGWPNGVAVATQVSKQADVTQLFMLHPEACDRETMRVNWDYYEPRTQHGSSLSYGVYAITAAIVNHTEEAYRYFIRSCTVDLYNTNRAFNGGTFIGGIHTAACGVAWQIVVQGFLGMHVDEAGLRFAPNLPERWKRVSVPLRYRGSTITVTVEDNTLVLSGASGNTGDVPVRLGDSWYSVPPGEEIVISLT